MQFDAVTLDSSLKLVQFCNSSSLSLDEASRSRKIAGYEVDVMKITGFCEKVGWLEASGGEIHITKKAAEILFYEKHSEMLRTMLDMIFESHHVYWKSILSRGRREAKLFLEGNQYQILEWCGLFEEGDDISDWWLDQRVYSNDEEEIENAQTGRKGERRTLIYEEARIGREPDWTAFEVGDREGFDVLSWIDGSEGSESLRIEVKASKREIEHATFFLTRNEWDTAISGGAHVFHLWPEIDSNSTEPLLVTVDQMRTQVPDDSGDGTWLNTEIPMATFL